MKKEAPEQTTLSGQKPISVILDEIRERAKANTSTRAWPLSDVPKLVKALRKVEGAFDYAASELQRVAPKSHAITVLNETIHDIAAILNQK